jgi:hypothetical protein
MDEDQQAQKEAEEYLKGYSGDTSSNANPYAAFQEKKKDSSQLTQNQKDRQAISNVAKSTLNALGNPSASDIAPRYFGYGAGAIAGPPAAMLLQKVSPENLMAGQLQRDISSLAVPQMQAELAKRKAALNPQPEQPTIQYQKPAGNPKYVHSMAGTGEEVPINLANSAVSMRSGDPTGMGAHDILDANAQAADLQRRLGGGDYTLHTQGVTPSAKPEVPAQLFLPEGEKLPSQVLAEKQAAEQAAAKAAKGVMGKTAEAVGTKAGQALDYGKMLLNTPAAKAIMHGANIGATGVQGIADIYNEDPLGMAIDVGQLGANIFGGPLVKIGGLTVGETARYLKEHPEVRNQIENTQIAKSAINAIENTDYSGNI